MLSERLQRLLAPLQKSSYRLATCHSRASLDFAAAKSRRYYGLGQLPGRSVSFFFQLAISMFRSFRPTLYFSAPSGL